MGQRRYDALANACAAADGGHIRLCMDNIERSKAVHSPGRVGPMSFVFPRDLLRYFAVAACKSCD